MATTELKHMHQDIELLKRDIAVIKHILSQEGELSEDAVRRLEKARRTPDEKYIRL